MSPAGRGPNWEDRKQEALLTQYQEVREEIRMVMEAQGRRVTRGLAAVGVVTGYGLVAGRLVFLSLVPVIIAFVFMYTLMDHNSVLILGWHAANIELELSYETFSWEYRYGEVIADNRRNALEPWVQFPVGAVLAVGVVTYLAFSWIGYRAVHDANYGVVAGVRPSKLLMMVYLMLTATAVVSAYGHLRTKAEIRRQL